MLRSSATIVLVLLLSAPLARAAEMVSASEADFVAEEPPPVPVFSWSGPYLGLQAGYGFGRDRAAAASGPAGSRMVLAASTDGVIGGGHVGYLLSTEPLTGLGSQNAGVLGLEGEVDGTNRGGKGFAPGTPGGLGFSATRSDVEGSLRARFGLAAQRVLFYGTGGIAFADIKTSDTLAGGDRQDYAHARTGYTVGGGVEWALMNSLSLRAEYRFSDFGRFTDPATASGPATIPVVHRDTNQRLQTGLSYRFGGFPPHATTVQ